MESSRRDLLKMGAAITGVTAAMAAGLNFLHAADSSPGEKRGDMLYRKLGRTGEMVSLIGLGGYHLGKIDNEADAIKLVRAAIDRGITFMDNCWDYHNGKSEQWMGKALRDGYREKVFLMTKTDGRNRKTCAQQLEESLKRLGTDHIDLVQHHEIIRMEDPEKIYAEGGADEALREAQTAGKVRFIGFTGHKDPKMHLHMLEVATKKGVRNDTVQMPLNVLDAHYKSFEKLVLPELVKNDIGVLAMKTLAEGHALKTGKVTAIECLQYAMNLPVSVVVNGMETMERLNQAIEAVTTFKPMSQEQVAALLEKTKDVAGDGKFEPFKTTQMYDGTVQNPHWLG